MSFIKFSIITISYNSEKYIEDTLKSVLKQTYNNIEYIIIDGNSKDNTLKIINSYKENFNEKIKIISEKDKGIYDAMNKGLEYTNGDIVSFLNSDDVFAHNKVLENVFNVFNNNSNCDACYGNIAMVKRNDLNDIKRIWSSSNENYFSKCKYGWVPAHPSFFAKKELYDKYGNFDLQFKIAADFDLICRFIEKYNINLYYIDDIMIKMRVEGTSNNGIKPIIKGNKEAFLALKKNDIFPYFIFLKPIRKIIQIIKAKLYNKNIEV